MRCSDVLPVYKERSEAGSAEARPERVFRSLHKLSLAGMEAPRGSSVQGLDQHVCGVSVRILPSRCANHQLPDT